MAQREVQRNAEDSDAATTGRKTPWTRKRAARTIAELASMAKSQKRLPSMQTTATGNMSSAADHAGTPQQPGASQLSAASPQQLGASQLSAASPQQPSASQLTAANSQQPGPSQLTATGPDTPFPVWSESDDDDDLYATHAEDEMVTQSSSHVNENHGRGMMCPYS